MRLISGFLSLAHSNFSPPAWATISAGFFVLIALSFSAFLVFEHLSAYKNPEEQKFLIGVILMVPCYSIESYVSLVNPSLSVDCGILRDCYEDFAMYCFGRYFVACLGSSHSWLIHLLKAATPPRAFHQLVVITSMCLQEQAHVRPIIADVVVALEHVASQPYMAKPDSKVMNMTTISSLHSGKAASKTSRGGNA